MSATMREVTDKCTRQSLGISSFLEIKKNPTNPRISFINTKGKLNVQNLAEMLKVKGRQCPRILISYIREKFSGLWPSSSRHKKGINSCL